MDDLKDTIRTIEALTAEQGFIYTLSVILVRDLFLDPAKLAEIDWQDPLSAQELTFLIGLAVKRPINLEIPTEEDSTRRFEEVYRLFLELHEKHSRRFFEKLGAEMKHPTPEESVEDNYRRMFAHGKLMAEPIFYSGARRGAGAERRCASGTRAARSWSSPPPRAFRPFGRARRRGVAAWRVLRGWTWLAKLQAGTGTLVYLPQSFNGIDWHQQLLVLEAAVGVVGVGVGAGAGAVTVST